MSRPVRILLLFLPLWLAAGACTKPRPVKKPVAAPVVKPAPTCPATAPQAHVLEVRPLWPLEGLDLRPRYVERLQLNDRTLERQRYKVMISGEKNWREHFFLAVLLWRMAEIEEGALKVPPAQDAPAGDVLAYRRALRTIQNYRTESLLHLDYLYYLPNMTPAALERLAYYTAHVQGAAAIPYFYKLLEHPKVPDFRYYVLDFAGLLLSDRRCSEARQLLGRGVPANQAGRGQFIESLVRVCQPPTEPQAWKAICAKVSEGTWHDFIPVLARGLWLSTMGVTPDAATVKGICPELAADGARMEHFRHVFAELDRSWRPRRVVTPLQVADGDDRMFAAVMPTLREFATVLLFLHPSETELKLSFEQGRWAMTSPKEVAGTPLAGLLESQLPVPVPAKPACPVRVSWTIRFKKPEKPADSQVK